MQANLSPSTEAFLANVVASGVYRNRAEAIEAGIEMLRSRMVFKDRLANSKAQLDRGEGKFLGNIGLASFLAGIASHEEQ